MECWSKEPPFVRHALPKKRNKRIVCTVRIVPGRIIFNQSYLLSRAILPAHLYFIRHITYPTHNLRLTFRC